MILPEIVNREQWTRERVALLEQEKPLTEARDQLATERRCLPVVEAPAGLELVVLAKPI
jgi:predicted dithiol-disulfide oxidoreductase (DUF899 family)